MSWKSWAKDNHNSRIADYAVSPPLTLKWSQPLPCGGTLGPHYLNHQGSRLLHHDGKIFVCFIRKTSPWIDGYGQILKIYDDATGELVYTLGRPFATAWGSIGMFVINGDRIYGACDHVGGWAVNYVTKEYVKLSGSGGPSPMPGFVNADELGFYGYGEDGVNSVNVIVKAVSFEDLTVRKWQNTRVGTTKGITSLQYPGFCYTYPGHGHLATHGNSLYVPDGILREYNKIDGTTIWQDGTFPQEESLGKVCYYCQTLYADGMIYAIGRECTRIGNLDNPYPQTMATPTGYVATQWSVPRLYGFDASSHRKNYQIDLPEYNEVLKSYSDNNFLYDFSGFPFEIIVQSGMVYVSCRDRIIAIRLSDSSILWTYNKLPSKDSFPSPYGLVYHSNWQFKDVAGDFVLSGDILFGSHRFGNYIFGIDKNSGHEVWRFTSPEQVDYFTGLIVDENKIFGSTIKGMLYCWESKNEPPIPPDPKIAELVKVDSFVEEIRNGGILSEQEVIDEINLKWR